MRGPKQLWRSPKAWLFSAATVAAVWMAAYLLAGHATAATVIATIFALIGVAGALFT